MESSNDQSEASDFMDEYVTMEGMPVDYEVQINADPRQRQRTQRAMRRTLNDLEQDMGFAATHGYHSSTDDSRSTDGSVITTDSALLAAPFPWRAIEEGSPMEDESLIHRGSVSGSVAAGASTGQPPSLVMTGGLPAPRKSIFEGTSCSFEPPEYVGTQSANKSAPPETKEGVWSQYAKAYDPFHKPRVGKRNSFQQLLACLCVFSVVVGIVIGIMLIVQTNLVKGNKDENADITPSPTPEGYIAQFTNVVGDSVYAHNSPEKRAAEWIIREDPMQLSPHAPRLTQRYLLAVFYFAANDNGAKRWRSCGAHEDSESECAFDRLVRNPDDSLGYQPEIAHRWLSEKSECDWAGVLCHDNNVHGIDLAGQNITGPVPVELAYLPALQTISLHYNSLTGGIPKDYYYLSLLANLDLHGNHLTGTVPEEVYHMTHLEQLNIGENRLVGSISPQLGQLTALKGLHVGNNYLTGKIPDEIGQLTDLTHTRWDNNHFAGHLPETLENLSKLEELWVQANRLGGQIPPQLGVLQKLKDLQLYQNGFLGSVPEELYDLNNLLRLEISENDLTGTLSTRIGRLRKLTDLRMRRNKLTGPLPLQLGALDNLKILWLHQNQFDGAVPDTVCQTVGLDFLNADCGPSENPANPCTCCTGCCDRETDICLVTSEANTN